MSVASVFTLFSRTESSRNNLLRRGVQLLAIDGLKNIEVMPTAKYERHSCFTSLGEVTSDENQVPKA